MKNGIFAAALAVAAVTSSAAIAAPKGDGAQSGGQDRDFTCLVPYPGPMGFKRSPCWRDFSGDS